MSNIWRDRLQKMATTEEDKGNHAGRASLLRWSRDEHVIDLRSFVHALLDCGFSVLRIAEEVIEAQQVAAFWMVYREGGREPTFKHNTVDDARREAQRIAKASVCATYVLAAIEKIEPATMPTIEEFRRHAELYGPGDGVGLWRILRNGDQFPTIVPVRVNGGDAWWASHVSGVNLHRVGVHQGDKWFPLDADGKDIDNSEIPFRGAR